MHGSRGDEEGVACLQSGARLAFQLKLHRSLPTVAGPPARMGVLPPHSARAELRADLYHLAPRSAEVVPLQLDPIEPRLLCVERLDCPRASERRGDANCCDRNSAT